MTRALAVLAAVCALLGALLAGLLLAVGLGLWHLR